MRLMTKGAFTAGAVLLLLYSVVFAGTGQSVVVQSLGGNSITISVSPDSLGADTLTVNGEKCLELNYRGAVAEVGGEGGYVRSFIPVMVGVFSPRVQVQVLQADYATVPMLAPQRNPSYATETKPQTVSEFVSYDGPFIQRRHLVARLRVYPYSYDSRTGMYKLLRRIVVQVTSSGSSVQTPESYADPLLSESLVNYDQVKNAVAGEPSKLLKTTASSVLAQGHWYKLAVYSSGIYKLTYSQLKAAGVPIDSVDMSTIRIFNNGGTELPEDPNASRVNDLEENAIYVSGAGKFGANDYLLFYGKSTRGWTYDPGHKTYSHFINNYSDTNYYFMTWGGVQGKRMAVEQGAGAASYYRPQSFTCGIFQDSSMFNLLGSGQDWYGPELQPPSQGVDNSTYLWQNKLYGLNTSGNITYRVRLISRSDLGTSNYFSISENSTGTALGVIPAGTVDMSSFYSDIGYYAYPLSPYTATGPGNLPDDRSIFRVSYSATSTSSVGYIDWMELLYQRYFQSLGDVLDFYGPDTTSNVYYAVSGFSSNNVDVFDVTDFANAAMVTPDSVSNGTAYFGSRSTAGSSREYYAVGDKGYLTVSSISAVQNSNLHGELSGADLIIVTAPDFLTQADELASWKESNDGLKSIVVTTTQIYDEFGCGIPDPTAIRDYLKYAYTNDQQLPSYVLLFGSGTYDYKGIVAKNSEFVPPYESQESLYQTYTYCSDDYYVQFTAPLMQTPISMAIGRLPARTTGDADAMVSKIKSYESSPDYGSWRNLITFIGDQGLQTKGIDDGSLHTDSADLLAQNYTPASFDKRKIYLILYPVINTTQGRRIPQAAADIVNQVNDGTLIVNFVGHGAPNVWSYTHVFENAVTIPQLTNKNRLTLFVAATCDFSRYDDPSQYSGGELLVDSQQGGAIGVVSATRVVYATDNETINSGFFQNLLYARDSQHRPPAIGEALFETKQADYQLHTYIKYNYLGDPTVRIGMPLYDASVDSLNGKSLSQTAHIRALDKLDIKGSVYQSNGSQWSNLSSTGLVTVYDSDKPVYVPAWDRTYLFQGSILFRGQVSVKEGKFDAQMVIPSDISYSNSNGKVELYFQGGGADGLGYTRNVIVGGTDTNVTNNHIAPQISIYFDSRNFKDGDIVSSNPTMIVDLHAANGLNLSDAAVGHGLEAIFDGGQSVNLAPYYTGKLDSYQDGTVTYPVTADLSYGQHSVTVQAFDVFNNPAEASASFDVESDTTLSITDVYNYPDPFRSGTAFTFRRTAAGGAGEPINVTIKVFTIGGRLIKTIKAYGITDTFVKVDWDGLDDEGDRLSNGVYLYKVIATTIDGTYTSEALGKMAVVR